ncbi:hypothetical protein [Tepidibacillus marianensis]|uniref:DHH family phosphoesterase n=1 Tax=Tepidibacillus marianensis TaxID=3131995 RepID=UPI0030CC39B7
MNDYTEQLVKTAQFIHQYDSFLIVSHVNPDGDTISSSLAMAHILKNSEKHFGLLTKMDFQISFHFYPCQTKFN